MEWLKLRFATEMKVIKEENPTMPIKNQVDLAGNKMIEIVAKYVSKIQDSVLIEDMKRLEIPF